MKHPERLKEEIELLKTRIELGKGAEVCQAVDELRGMLITIFCFQGNRSSNYKLVRDLIDKGFKKLDES